MDRKTLRELLKQNLAAAVSKKTGADYVFEYRFAAPERQWRSDIAFPAAKVAVEIDGGIWDGNCDNMGLDAVYEALHREDDPYDPKLFKGKLLRFAHIDRLVLEKLAVKNPVSYAVFTLFTFAARIG